MPVMLSKTYEAFIAAVAPEGMAREAAEELAAYEAQFANVNRQLTEIPGELLLLKRMLGVVIAGTASLMAGAASLVLKIFA